MDPLTQKLKEEALELFGYSKNYWENHYEKTMKQCCKVFKRQIDPGYPLHTNLFIPYGFSNLMTALSRLMDAVFSSRELVSFLPSPGAEGDHALRVEKLINRQYETTGAFWSFYSIFLTAMIYGFAPGKVLWEDNAPKLSPLDPWEFYFDPACEWDLQKSGWIIQRNIKTVSQLERMVKQGVYQAELKKLSDLSLGAQGRKEAVLGEDSERANTHSKLLQCVEVLECWLGDKIVTIAGGELVLRCVDNPYGYFPFVQLICNPFPHEPVGEGLLAPCLDLQKEINNQRNLRLDLALKQLRPQWKIIGDNLDEEELIWTPDGLIHLTPGEDVQPLLPPNGAANSLQEESRAYQDIDRAMGVNDVLRGELTEPQETATGLVTRLKSGSNRLGLLVYSAGRMIEQITRIMLDFNRRYLSGEQWLEGEGEKALSIKRAELLAPDRYRYVPICNTTSLKEVYRQQLMTFFNLLRNDPHIDQPELLKNLLDAFEIKDKDKLLKPVSPAPAQAPAAGEQPAGEVQP